MDRGLVSLTERVEGRPSWTETVDPAGCQHVPTRLDMICGCVIVYAVAQSSLHRARSLPATRRPS
jgi:hypothetical protein